VPALVLQVAAEKAELEQKVVELKRQVKFADLIISRHES
jgi:hypothetical protein